MKKFKKIYVEITNICNLYCPFCSVDKKIKKEMSLEEFEYILKQINDYTDYLYLHVKGEPLLHSKFKEILNLCKKYNKKVNITTNGTLLYKKYNDLIDSVRQVNISLHSFNHDMDKMLEIGSILSKKSIQVVYRFWVLNDNYTNIDAILNYYNLNKEILKNNNIKLEDNVYLNKDEEFIWPSLDNDFISNKGTCYGTRSHVAILSDGVVIPCCLDSSGVINLGNIFETNFKDILESERYQNMKIGFQNNKICEELCQKCDFRRRLDND